MPAMCPVHAVAVKTPEKQPVVRRFVVQKRVSHVAYSTTASIPLDFDVTWRIVLHPTWSKSPRSI